MVLSAILMSVNFVSCDKDGDSTTQPNNGKKLVKMLLYSESGYNDVYDFKYSKDGRISEIREDYIHSFDGVVDRGIDIYKYNWYSKDSIIVTVNGEKRYTYTLSKGKVIREFTHPYDGMASSWGVLNDFTYDNDGNIKESIFTEGGSAVTTTYTWLNDKISRVTDDWDSYHIRYSDTTCKGFFPIFPEIIGHYADLFMVHPELIGLKNSYLPTEISDNWGQESKFSYEYDADGYIKNCMINVTYYTNGEYVFEFVWE